MEFRVTLPKGGDTLLRLFFDGSMSLLHRTYFGIVSFKGFDAVEHHLTAPSIGRGQLSDNALRESSISKVTDLNLNGAQRSVRGVPFTTQVCKARLFFGASICMLTLQTLQSFDIV
jgi:hypothetical protein